MSENVLNSLLQHYPPRSGLNNRVYIGEFTYGTPEIKTWGEDNTLTIGKFCSISDRVTIFLGGEHRSDWVTTYPFSALLTKYSYIKGHPRSKGNVTIGNDVWIAHGVTIMSGVTIGNGAVIGCNSLVSKNVPPYAIVAGNPSRIVRYRFSKDIVEKLLKIQWWNWNLQDIEMALPLMLNNNINSFINYAKNKNNLP